MFKLKEKINKSTYFIVSENHLILKTIDKDVIYKNEVIDTNISDDIILYGNSIYYNNKKGMIIKNLNNSKKIQIDDYFILNTKPINCQYSLIYYNSDFSIFIFDKKDLNKNKITIKDYDWGTSYFSNTHIFINNQNQIQTYSLTNPQTPLWQFDLSQFDTFRFNGNDLPYKVEKIIGIHQERLYVALNGAMILEIDIETGELTHQWQLNQEPLCSGKGAGINVTVAVLAEDTQQLEILSGNNYATINLQSKEVQHFCMQEELNKYNLVTIKSGSQLSFSPTHIFSAVLYFGDGKHIWDGVCAVNRKTHKIDWIFTDKKMAVGTNTPKIADNKLYQLSLDGELYIFEKTSNENV